MVSDISLTPDSRDRGGDRNSITARPLLPQASPARDADRLDATVEEGDPGFASECAISAAATQPAAHPSDAAALPLNPGALATGHVLSAGRGQEYRHPHRPFGVDVRDGCE